MTELLRVDVIAIFVMVSLAWLGLLSPSEAFSGFASSAVIAIIGVMILSYGVDRAGIMTRLSRPIIQAAGSSEKRLVGLVSASVGLISSFMQNIGAAGLFLPALMRISRNMRIPPSRLLMPMGFAAILGGTLTMVGSSPLIILNDLMRQGGKQTFGLFSVTPLGLVLLGSGICYFLAFGRFVLPPGKETEAVSPQEELIETWRLPSTTYQYAIPSKSPLIGKTREDSRIWTEYGLSLLALTEGDEVLYAPWRYTHFGEGQELLLLGKKDNVERFAADHNLEPVKRKARLEYLQSLESAGFAELIIPPRSPMAGKSIREIAMRKNYVVEPVLLLRGVEEVRGDFSDQKLQPGDAMIVHGPWENISAMGDNRNFVLATHIEMKNGRRSSPAAALVCFLGAIGLILAGFPLSLGLFTGALAMIVLGVVPIDEAYRAIDWRTVFLLAGLIPLGLAMDKSGTAAYTAALIIQVLQKSHPLLILISIASISTLFSLFMSNVAATVVLVPLVMDMGELIGIDPRALALLVAVCASNSFVLPTHQVNALLMSPGGYHNSDYLRAGGIMTLIFIAVAVGFIYLFYL